MREGGKVTVYNFNLLVGYVSTGVDYAQAYRARILRDVCPQKYVFTEIPRFRELQYFTRLGIRADELLVLPFSFMKTPSLMPSLTFGELRTRILPDTEGYFLSEGKNMRIFHQPENGQVILFRLTEEGFVQSVEYYVNSILLRKDSYSDRLLTSRFMPVSSDKNAKTVMPVRQIIYDEEGKTALEMFYTSDGVLYEFPDHSHCNTQELLERFLKGLSPGSDDVFILDRKDPHLLPILENKGDAKTLFVMHSRLVFEDYSDSHHWKGVSYEYTDLVRNASRIDALVTSTGEQALEIRKWFEEHYGISVRTSVVPVGGMEKMTFPAKPRKRHSLLTVSRLDYRKRIDLLIRAVRKARETIPDLTLDIYGEGPQYGEYAKLIEECGAGDYITLRGYVHNFGAYAEYEGYISASLWETFGLTILEAMSAGLPAIGLDVPYGNRAFIHTGKNGFLVAYDTASGDSMTTDRLADAVVQLFAGDLDLLSLNAYGEASKYTVDYIREQWIALFREIGVNISDRSHG